MIYLLLFIVYIYLIFPHRHQRKFKHRKYTHRGYHSKDQTLKENSLEAFRLSVEKGYGIELDVQLTKDGEVVVYHDFNLSRLERNESKLFDLTLEELKQFYIPTLQEVLALVDGQVELIIELKSDKNKDRLSEKVLDILDSYHGPYCVESFDPRIVYWFKKHAPQIKRGQLIMPISKYDSVFTGILINSLLYQFLTRPHFLAINVDSSHFNPSINFNQFFGIESCLWTVHENHRTDYKWVDAYIFEYFDA